MNFLKRLFDFEGTINGTQYLFRPMLSWAFLLTASPILGLFGPEGVEIAGPILTFVWITLAIWLGLSTTVKRARALSKKYTPTQNTLIILFVPFAAWWAIGENSDVEKHNG